MPEPGPSLPLELKAAAGEAIAGGVVQPAAACVRLGAPHVLRTALGKRRSSTSSLRSVTAVPGGLSHAGMNKHPRSVTVS